MAVGRFGLGAATVAALMLVAAPVLAQDWSELEGVRTGTATENLQARGYSRSGNSGGYQLWSDGRTCVGLRTDAGMVSDARGFHQRDCGGSSDGGSNDGAGAVVAGLLVAGLIGAAVASHDDHHHKNGQHGSGESEGEFERGYNDGLHDGPFSDYDRNPSYSEGWNAGQQERQNRLASNRQSYHSRGGANEARAACAAAADRYWHLDPGDSSATAIRGDADTFFEVDVAAGWQTATCTYQDGRVTNVG